MIFAPNSSAEQQIPLFGAIVNDSYRIGEMLAQTDQSFVFEATKLDDSESDCKKKYAIKFINTKSEMSSLVENELSLIKEIKSPFIVKTIDVFDYKAFKCVVMPLMQKNGLFHLTNSAQNNLPISLNKNNNNNEFFCLEEGIVKRIIYSGLKALKYLHENNIWHRDIKIANFLCKSANYKGHLIDRFEEEKNNNNIDKNYHLVNNGKYDDVNNDSTTNANTNANTNNNNNDDSFNSKNEISNDYNGNINDDNNRYHIFLADFGFAKKVTEKEFLDDEYVGSLLYAAPEIINHLPYNEKSDIWSLGVMMYILLSGVSPFPMTPETSMRRCISRGAFFYNDRYWKIVSKNAKNLIEKMMCVNIKNRFSAEQALAHHWFDDLIVGPSNIDKTSSTTPNQRRDSNIQRSFSNVDPAKLNLNTMTSNITSNTTTSNVTSNITSNVTFNTTSNLTSDLTSDVNSIINTDLNLDATKKDKEIIRSYSSMCARVAQGGEDGFAGGSFKDSQMSSILCLNQHFG